MAEGSFKLASLYVDIAAPLVGVQKSFGRLQGMLTSVSASLANFGRNMLIFGGALAIPFTFAVKNAATFEEQMAKVATMLESHTMHLLPAMADGVRDLSVKMGMATDSLTDGLYAILSAQMPAKAAMDLLNQATTAAVAGASNTKVAVNALVKIMRAYAVPVEKAAEVTDYLFGVVREAVAEFPEVAHALPLVASTAAVAGISMEELGAAIATASRSMPSLNRAAFSFRAAMMSFITPSDKAKEVAKRYGLQMELTAIHSKGLLGVLLDLKKMPAQMLMEIFPRRSFESIAAILQQLPEYVQSYKDLLDNTGAAQEALNKRTATLGFQLRRLKMAIKDISVELGVPLIAAVMVAAKAIADSRKIIVDWIKENQNLTTTLAANIAVFVTLGAAALAFAGILKVLSIVIAATPWALFVAAIIMAAEAFTDLDLSFTDFVKGIRIGGKQIGTWMGAIANGLIRMWATFTNFLRENWEAAVKDTSDIMWHLWTAFKEVVLSMEKLWAIFTTKLSAGWDETVTWIAKQGVKLMISDPEEQKRALDNMDKDLSGRHTKRFNEMDDSIRELDQELINADQVLRAALDESEQQFLASQKVRTDSYEREIEDLDKNLRDIMDADWAPDGKPVSITDRIMQAYTDAVKKIREALKMPEGGPAPAGAAYAGSVFISQRMGAPEGPFVSTAPMDPTLSELSKQTGLLTDIKNNTDDMGSTYSE